MGEFTLNGDPPIAIKIRRSGRARRLSLRVSRLDGRVSMSVPNWTRQSEARLFVLEKENWIRRQLAGCLNEIIPAIDGEILLEGRKVIIRSGPGRSVSLVDGEMRVPGGGEHIPARVAAFLKTMARERLIAASDHYSAQLGRPYRRITLRDTRSRWGSCTSDGNLMFSWRLVMAPADVLGYVVAHEIAHLAEMNHSIAFWDVVGGLCPGYEKTRGWLRENGSLLHAYRFRN